MSSQALPGTRRPDPLTLEALRVHDGLDEERSLAPGVARLAAEGWLIGCLPIAAGGYGLATSSDPETILLTSDALRALGRVDLALARLYEGHLNAIKLVELHAGTPAREQVRTRVRAGTLLGVWGATAADPLTVTVTDKGWALQGAKAFTSGL